MGQLGLLGRLDSVNSGRRSDAIEGEKRGQPPRHAVPASPPTSPTALPVTRPVSTLAHRRGQRTQWKGNAIGAWDAVLGFAQGCHIDTDKVSSRKTVIDTAFRSTDLEASVGL